MANEPKHPPADMAGLDGLIERLRQDTNETDTWGRKKNWTEQRSERRKAATQLQALAARVKVLEAENERLREIVKEQDQDLFRYRVKYMIGTSAALKGTEQ